MSPRSLSDRAVRRPRLTIVAALVAALVIAIPVWAATSTGVTDNNDPSLTVAKPSGVVEGHFMLANVVFRGDSALQVNAPDGWTLVAKRTNTNGTPQLTQAVYYKAAGASEPAGYDWTFGVGGTTNTSAVGGIASYDDVDTSNPIDASATNHAGDASVAATTTASAPAVSTNTQHARVIALYALDSEAAFTTPPSGMATSYNASRGGNPDGRARVAAAEKIQAATGSGGPYDATIGSARYVAQTVALRRKPTKLAYTTTEHSGLKNTCFGGITVQTQGTGGVANAAADTVVTLASDGTGDFFSDAGCTTPLTLADRTILAGDNDATFFYKPTVTGDGMHELTASAAGLTSGTQTQTVTKLAQTITFNDAPITAQTFGTTFNVNPSASSGLPVSVVGANGCTAVADASPPGFDVTMTSGTTTCQLTASQGGDDDYDAAPNQVRNVTAQKAAQTITFDDAPATAQTFGTFFHVNPTASSGLPVTVTDGGGPEGCDAVADPPGYEVEVTRGNQPCNLTAHQVGDNNYLAAPDVLRTVQTQKANQTITFAQPPSPQTYGTTFGIGTATSDSALAVTVTPSGGCSLAGSDATMTSGTNACLLTASQDGNNNYNEATDVARTVAAAKKELTVSGAVAQNKVYDGTRAATVDFSTATLNGVVAPDTTTLNSSAYVAEFDTKNAGTGKAVAVSGLATSDHADDYSITPPSLTADITKKDTGGAFTAANKVYDGTAAATVASQTLNGEVSGDDVDLTGTAAFADKVVGNGKTVTLSDSALTGADKDNYSLVGSVADSAANITARPVSGSFTAADKDFDGTTAATITGRSLPGAIAGDLVALIQGTATFANANPGVNKTVTGTGFTLGGPDAGNYTLTGVGTTTATIRQRGPGEAPSDLSQDAASLLGGTVKQLGLDFNGLAFAFARQSQGKTLTVGTARLKLFAIGGCTAPCTIDAAKTLVLRGTNADAGTAATKRIKLKTQKLSLAAGELGVITLKLTKKQLKAIRKANKRKLVVKTTVKSAGQKATAKKTYKLKPKKG